MAELRCKQAATLPIRALAMKRKLSIAMVSDFFYPSNGGVETHIRYLGEELIMMGHKVIVITHKAGDHVGCRMVGNIKTYFLDIPIVCRNVAFPSLFSNFSLLKEIFDEEEVEIVHGHQTMSSMCIEALFHAITLNLKTVITDHSIFEVGPFENIVVNALCRFVLKSVGRCICVTYTSKENTHLRTHVPLDKIHVIPNAMLSELFYPDRDRARNGKVVIIVCRLVYRKGVDLLAGAIPIVCKADPDVRFIIVGDGPMRECIEQALDEHGLYDRVDMMSDVCHEQVGSIMRKGDVFLNASLTEAFCIAIVEAASCGLHVVSTNVGGVHEVLPPDMITFSRLTAHDLAKNVLNALKKHNHDKHDYNQRLKSIYNWRRVAEMTEDVYTGMKATKTNYIQRRRLYKGMSGFIFRLFITIEYILLYAISTSK
ncbi:glycosyl transferase [Ordospora pajunii]|uniref:glycosyl transferase n=1 Tax=Ordospora pajunii TaxID=3039483 RepID=UPI0029526F23|nr:glycosyl transferase [Ordospora pajunii]KAH9412002.1 glycosyl transferase [Ordospora pajunii]